MSAPPGSDTFIPERLGGRDILIDDAPLVGTVEFIDGVVVFGPSIVFLLVSDSVLPSTLEPYSLLLSILIAAAGASLLVLKPKYKTVSEWIKDLKSFRQREKSKKKKLTTDGGEPITSHDVTPDDDTRGLTQVEKVHPHNNSIELADGTVLAIIEFSGSNLDMASGEMVANVVQQYSNAIGSQLQNEIQFYLPMRKVSMRNTAKLYSNRKGDPNNSPFMSAYLDDREDWLTGLSDGAFIREQYVVIPVSRREIYSKNTVSSSSPIESLPGGEIALDIKRGLLGSEIQSKQEVKRKQFRELDSRVDTISGILAKGPGNSASQVSAAKCVALLKEFWEGDDVLDGEFESMIREMPAVLGPNDGDNK